MLRRLLTLTAIVWLATGAQAGGEELLEDADIRAAFVAELQGLESFAADFRQVVRDADGNVLEEATGDFRLARPDRFRWRYDEPLPREIIADGTDIWLYDIELDQVTVRPFAGIIEQTPAGILAGDLELLDAYTIGGQAADDDLLVMLQPASNRPDFTDIRVRFVNGQLAGMQLTDQFGQTTAIVFSAVDRNPDIDPAVFQFSLPANADLIDER